MLEKKIYGSIFLSTMDRFTLTELCNLSNSKKVDVKQIVEKLVKAKKIRKEGNKYIVNYHQPKGVVVSLNKKQMNISCQFIKYANFDVLLFFFYKNFIEEKIKW